MVVGITNKIAIRWYKMFLKRKNFYFYSVLILIFSACNPSKTCPKIKTYADVMAAIGKKILVLKKHARRSHKATKCCSNSIPLTRSDKYFRKY